MLTSSLPWSSKSTSDFDRKDAETNHPGVLSESKWHPSALKFTFTNKLSLVVVIAIRIVNLSHFVEQAFAKAYSS